jgi:hypothetical protein
MARRMTLQITERRAGCTTARFILDEARALGIAVGTDGVELVMVAPLRIPRASRLTFEAAFQKSRDEIIAHILAESTP